MRLNENTAVSTSRVLLVPYDAHHVEKYHQWMEDPSIREATASERLSLEEEYENQASWREASDKLTFIVCAPLLRGAAGGGNGSSDAREKKGSVVAGVVDAADRMVGDVNLFLSPWDDDDDDYDEKGEGEQGGDDKERKGEDAKTYYTAEIDIMIADPRCRGKGLGRAAVATFLSFVRRHLDSILAEYTAGSLNGAERNGKPVLRDVVAKINAENTASIVLFKALGFEQRGERNYFGEIRMVFEGFGGADGWEGRRDSGVMGEGYEELVYDRLRLKMGVE
ncbi:GNAT domain-containing protein [Daldinia caldariorum]|uniref:GNAT domain-containing protein n=1 Tax=Daldinia caldariorum TaxID=326644 RepID=UPI002008C492|nr:GNAT domain-containing protein [Daldinia caldariorum]KAI1469734.1 GNAT domain-containing protein [Daldinia caldariorum]